jgi:hypothetical protein
MSERIFGVGVDVEFDEVEAVVEKRRMAKS